MKNMPNDYDETTEIGVSTVIAEGDSDRGNIGALMHGMVDEMLRKVHFAKVDSLSVTLTPYVGVTDLTLEGYEIKGKIVVKVKELP